MEPTTDPRDGAAHRIGRDSPGASLEPPATTTDSAADVPMPEPGDRWRHYQLGKLIPGGPGRCFNATDANGRTGIMIRVVRIGAETAARRTAWSLLKDLHAPWMVELIGEQEEYGLRYEISHVPAPMTLGIWAARRGVSLPDFEALVRQLSQIVKALHGCGVVHLNLRPDTLHVASVEGDLQIGLGGLEFATLYDQPQPIAIPVDPLYAPPEAVGLERQPAGRGLCAWDWWSLGRVVQEIVVGKHIYADLLQLDVTKGGSDVRSQAEALLNESGDYQVRAGAVELMPAMYDTQVGLLRGLLTTVREGRWGFREVQRWLEKRPAKDRYDSPRGERFFIRPDGVYTIPEAAEFFAQEANWKEGESNLFDADDPASLAHFIASEPANIDLYERLTSLFDLGGIPEWRGVARSAIQTALAAGAWAVLGGPKVGLVLRGRRVTHRELQALLQGGKDGPALARALLVAPYIAEVQKADPETGSMLAEVATAHSAALARTIEGGWVDKGDQTAWSRLLALALEPPNVLADAQRRVRARFARTRNPVVEELMAVADKDRCAQLVLAYAEFCPERFGFVTQEELDRERYADLKRRAQRLAAALFWLRLGQVLSSNPLVFGPWKVLAGIWLGLAVFAWRAGLLVDAHSWVALLLVVPPMLRLAHWAGFRRLLERHAPEARRWTWLDGVGRCRKELPAAFGGADVPSEDRMVLQLEVLNRKIAELPLKAPPPRVSAPGRLPALWTTSAVSWLILVLVFGSALRSGVHRVRVEGWRIIGFGSGNAIPRVVEEVAEESPAAYRDWSFGDPRRQRVAWNLPRPAAIPLIDAEKTLVATPDQVALALVEGERELLPFLRRSVKPLVAVPVPTEAGVGLILFDSRNGTVAERRVYLVGRLPPAPSWLKLAGHEVVFLGNSPPEAAPEDAAPTKPEPGPIVGPEAVVPSR